MPFLVKPKNCEGQKLQRKREVALKCYRATEESQGEEEVKEEHRDITHDTAWL